MSLEELRSRNKNGILDKFIKAAGRSSLGKKTTNNQRDETYYPERDKSGNGSAVFRFLPGLEREDNPYYVERFQHGFEFNNKWFVEFCPSTPNIDKECPTCDDNFDTIGEYGKWDDVPKDVQDVIRKRSRTAGFEAGNYCNIKVIKDPANPENEGKVHLFNFGKGIMDMILEMAQPVDDGLGDVPTPVDVFDLENGADFKFIIRKKDGRANYEKSSFEKPSPCEINDEDQFPLFPLVDEKKFKSYEELSKRLAKVLGNKFVQGAKNAEEAVKESAEAVPDKSADVPKKSTKKEKKVEKEEIPDAEGDSSVDDNMEYFKNIADELEI